MPGEQPAAKRGDLIVSQPGSDIHCELVPAPGGAVPTPVPNHPFNGVLQDNLSPNVDIMGMPAATVGSIAINTPPHIPLLGPSFCPPGPTNRGQVLEGSLTVFINGKAAARNRDVCLTCNDPAPLPVGNVIASGTVFMG